MKIDPNWMFFSMTWIITTGDDDKREDSTVNAVVVMKPGAPFANTSALLGDGVGNWTIGDSTWIVGQGGVNGPGVSGVGLPNDCYAAAVDHFELQFKSHALGLEATDTWNLWKLNVYASFFDKNNRRHVGYKIWSHDYGRGNKLVGVGTEQVPFNLDGIAAEVGRPGRGGTQNDRADA